MSNDCPREVAQQRRSSARDCLFLSLAVLVSVTAYIGRLGFYSDDWGLVGALRGSNDQSVPSLFRFLVARGGMEWRPVQALYLTLLYKLSGVHPLGYHVANTVLFAAITCLFYLCLSLLDQPRLLAIAVPLVYILLPNYSTNRFWLIVPGTLCMVFYFLNLYALLRASQARGLSGLAWAALSVVALLASALSWEVALPLFAVNLFLALWQGRHRWAKKNTRVRLGLTAAVIGNLVALASVGLFKAETAVRFHANKLSLTWLKYVVFGAVRVHFIDYGVRLPRVLYLAARMNPDWKSYVLAGILGLGIFWYLNNALSSNNTRTPASHMLKFMAWGLLVFAAGNAIFVLAPGEVGFVTTGVGNRINIAAAVGAAMIFVGGIGFLGSLMPKNESRRFVEHSLIAIFCVTGLLINNAIASFWVRASQRQREVLADVLRHIPSIPHGTTLILDRVCPYIGPGIVFECYWDVGPAVQILYHDSTLQGDIVTPRLQVEEKGLATKIYGTDRHYPYSRNLLIYNFRTKMVESLVDAETARRYFQAMDPAHGADCPGTEGYEVPIF
jgi:hypothetical protein